MDDLRNSHLITLRRNLIEIFTEFLVDRILLKKTL